MINRASFGPLLSAIIFAISQPSLLSGVFESQLKPIKGTELLLMTSAMAVLFSCSLADISSVQAPWI
jgi:hypothetical protein